MLKYRKPAAFALCLCAVLALLAGCLGTKFDAAVFVKGHLD